MDRMVADRSDGIDLAFERAKGRHKFHKISPSKTIT